MHIFRYTCVRCGIVTRVELAQSYCACACRAAYEVVDETDETQTVVVIDPIEPS